MGWADNYIARLRQGETVEFRPRGRLHLVTATYTDGSAQISNNKGRVNGRTKALYGRLVRMEA